MPPLQYLSLSWSQKSSYTTSKQSPPRKCGRYCVELQREEANMELQWDEADTELHGEHAV